MTDYPTTEAPHTALAFTVSSDTSGASAGPSVRY